LETYNENQTRESIITAHIAMRSCVKIETIMKIIDKKIAWRGFLLIKIKNKNKRIGIKIPPKPFGIER
jgi:hypothetical protein